MHKKFITILSISFISISMMVGFSPFKVQEGNQWPMIKTSIIINAPTCQVYEYLGNSDHAKEWSAFVDHITLIAGKDGMEGSVRRCFKDEAEQKEQWDETTIISEPCIRRKLTVFNLKNFAMSGEGLLTEQIYEPLGDGKSKLSFTLFLEEEQNYFWPLLKMHFFSYEIKNIFQKNLEQIKKINQNNTL